MTQSTGIAVRLRIDFGAVASIGPGKIDLLEHVERHESLSQAARELGMSYRRAWELMNDLNRSFAEPVVSASAGGSGGGGATLTPFGRKLLRTFRAVESQVGKLAGRKFADVLVRANGGAPVKRTRLSRRPAK